MCVCVSVCYASACVLNSFVSVCFPELVACVFDLLSLGGIGVGAGDNDNTN